MLRNLDLRLLEKLLEMAHAKGALAEQVQYPQPGSIAEALVNADKVHSWTMHGKVYASRRICLMISRMCWMSHGGIEPFSHFDLN
jgi:hypothetical protein